MLRQFAGALWARLDPSKRTIRRLAREVPGPGGLVIDCGANVGDITSILSQRGAQVIAFEPDPAAFAKLSERFSGNDRVTCRREGVGCADGEMELYPHVNAVEDPVYWSTGSSFLRCKSNIDSTKGVVVKVVDLATFVFGLGRRIDIVKMDIEGVECEVVNHLIDSGAIRQIERLYVETHDHRIPELATETQALRERVARENLGGVIDLTWK